jgi:Protein of unknown function (DUF3833)
MPVTFPLPFGSSFWSKVELALRAMVALASFSLSSSCAGRQPQDLVRSHSSFELIRFFTGHSRSWGVFETSHGQPSRYFRCDSYGKRNTWATSLSISIFSSAMAKPKIVSGRFIRWTLVIGRQGPTIWWELLRP